MNSKILFLLVVLIFLTGCTGVEVPCALGWHNDTYFCNEFHFKEKIQVNYTHHISYSADCNWIISGGAWLPDPECSLGDAFPLTTIQINGEYAEEPGGVIVGDICVSGYSANIRDVTQARKEQVYAAYGVVSRVTGEYEVDHIIPLAIGGTNEVTNLFPQPAYPLPGFHQKDVCEVCFKNKICKGELDIREAQKMMAKNWTRCLDICGVDW
jgi:hypothetical protein